ncbi:hypothetical protein PIROE2DRAFT_58739 [Piromyces sp. E2]|nr:hypothetical protein PIROE2DRAFT_58739 [Piromyces sp. E2]|eukprot:OUM67513.1 hypothetical protein PIROE2DRAFT_58739 [Piromyces sp. E2]
MLLDNKSIFLSFAIYLMVNSINVFARSIDTTGETEVTAKQTSIKLPAIVCIVGVVAVVASGGFCLFSKKKQKRPSEQYLNSENSDSNYSSSSSSPNTSKSDIRQLNNEAEEVDITVKVDKMNKTENNKVESQPEEGEDAQPKRRSFLDSILKRNPKKERRTSNIQFTDDRSLNSISTNEDWINEQKLQAELRNKVSEDLYDNDDDYEEVNSNDGFWNSDLQPIQSSSENKAQSYGVPSLGKRNSVIVKGSDSNVKRQSVVIVDGSEETAEAEELSEKSVDMKPTRVKSWKNNDLDKELKEILKNIEDDDSSINKEKQ